MNVVKCFQIGVLVEGLVLVELRHVFERDSTACLMLHTAGISYRLMVATITEEALNCGTLDVLLSQELVLDQ